MRSQTVNEIVDSTDFLKLHHIVSSILAKGCWRVDFGYGGDLRLNFGARIPYESPQMAGEKKGKWRFSTMGTAWMLFTPNGIVRGKKVKKRDEESLLKKTRAIEGGKVTSLEVSIPSNALSISFSNGCLLRVLPSPEDDKYDIPYWELLLPGHMFVAFGPGNRWSFRRSDVPILVTKPEPVE